MPTYVYRCLECGQQFEVQQSFSDAPITTHGCGGPVRKVFTPVGVTFKGSGFYKTDSRGSKAKSTTTATSGEAGTSDSPSTTSGGVTGGSDSSSGTGTSSGDRAGSSGGSSGSGSSGSSGGSTPGSS